MALQSGNIWNIPCMTNDSSWIAECSSCILSFPVAISIPIEKQRGLLPVAELGRRKILLPPAIAGNFSLARGRPRACGRQ
ncbi:MAG: hypothetical protein Q6373_005915 [Candidatus Sigynarchaeota archaeon]